MPSWVCELLPRHTCLQCGGAATGQPLVKCSMRQCGRYYHPACAAACPLTHALGSSHSSPLTSHPASLAQPSPRSGGPVSAPPATLVCGTSTAADASQQADARAASVSESAADQSAELIGQRPGPGSGGAGPASFRCPVHYCVRCGASGDSVAMVQCMRCPVGYHVR